MSESPGAAELVTLRATANALGAGQDFGEDCEQVNRRIVELAADDTLAYTRLARCLINKDESEAAEALYRRVLELQPDNLIAWNFVTDLKLARQAKAKGDVDAAAVTKAARKIGLSSPISAGELVVLTAACASIPEPEGEYVESNYMVNVLTTVLELQMHAKIVLKSINHYKKHHLEDLSTLDQLKLVLAQHPNDKEGNNAIARALWGNNHWMRVQWLRGFVPFLDDHGIISQDALVAWAKDSDYKRDFEGKVKHLGIAAYKWLVMRVGVETVKPDVHLHNFVEGVVGHRVTDDVLVGALEGVAKDLGKPPRKLDWAIWEYQRGGPGDV